MMVSTKENLLASTVDFIGSENRKPEAIVQQLVQQTIGLIQISIDPSVITSNDLKQQLKRHFDIAMTQFSEIFDTTDEKEYGKHRGLLIAELKIVFRDFCNDLQSKVDQNMQKVVLTFRSQVQSEVALKCLPTEKLQQLIQRIKESIIQESNVDLFQDNLEQLKNLLDEAGLPLLAENNRRLEKLYLRFNEILPDLLETYTDDIEMMLPDEELEKTSAEKIESTFKKCHTKLTRQLNKAMEFDNEDIKDMFEANFTSVLQEQFSEKIKLAKIQKSRKFEEANAVVSTVIKAFTNDMSSIVEENGDDSAIRKCQNDKVKAAISSLTMQIYDILPDCAKAMLESANKEMKNIVQEMLNQRHIQMQIFREKWETEHNSIREKFIEQLLGYSQLKMLPDMKEMQSIRTNLMNLLISKSNTSWMNGHKDERNLLKVFRRDAEELMINSSVTILGTHAELLGNIFEDHKLLMNKSLEDHKSKLNNLLKEYLSDDIADRAKLIGVNATRQFEIEIKNISPTCRSLVAQISADLKQAISKIEDQFQNQVRDRKLLVKAEVNRIAEGTVDDYSFLMNAFSIASNYSKEKIAQINNNLKDRAHHSLQQKLHSGKYSHDPKQLQQDLDTKIQKMYSKTLATIDIQHVEWNKRLKSCHQTINNHYIQQFTCLMGNVQKEDELEKLHADLKLQMIELWEESFPMDCYADKLLLERRKFATMLDHDFATSIRDKWQQINLNIDQKAKEAIESIVKEYDSKMKSNLHAFDYVSNEIMSSAHNKFAEKANESLKKVAKPEKVSEDTYINILQSRMANTLECYKTKNTQKQTDIESYLSNEIRQLKGNFTRDLFDLKVFPDMSTFVRNYYQSQVQPLIDNYKIPDRCLENLQQFGLVKLENALKEIEDEWDKKQPDPNELQLFINKAVEEYNREMENRTSKTGQVFAFSAMKKYHAAALTVVKKNFQRNIRQTSATREQFTNTIAEVFKKFQDLNDIRAADCFDAAIGIDLGTTFSCVAIYKGGKIEMIPDREQHSNTVPSYVFYETDKKTVVGHAAKDQSVIHPRNTIFDSKRLIGRKLMDDETQKDITHWPFKVVQDPDPKRKEFPKIQVHGQTFYPEEVSGEVLKHLKRNAELYLDREVKDVVITVPAYFNDAQKRATKAAAAFANINVLEIISEPTSAAIAYSLNYTDGKSRNILVFDLGGGTFDVSVLSTEKGDLAVKAVGGNNHLGGEDFDSNMVDFCIEKFRQATGLDIPKNVTNTMVETANAEDIIANEEEIRKTFERLRRLRQKCEQAKITLSKADKVRVVIDYIYDQKNLDVEITVQDFNQMNQLLFNKCIQVVKDTLRESTLDKEQIDDVILVGGSSRIPEVQRMLSEFFDGKSLIMTLNPDEVVAQGAAYRAAMLSGSKSSELKGIKFKDVNPLSLGVEVIGKKFSIIIPKNTPLPTTNTETYVTTTDYQTEIKFSVYEGEDSLVKNNNLLGSFDLEGIPSKKQGEEPVDVTLELDDEGLLHVTAKVKSNSACESITIKSNRGNLTAEDIQNAKSRNSS